MNTEIDIDLHAVIADLSQKIAALTQENSILKAVISAQRDAISQAGKQDQLQT